MVIKQATEQDFAYAFSFIEKLWDYNVYDKETVKSVYKEVLADDKSFAFFLCDEKGNYCGFCHGSFFPTFWMSGSTCYLASIITDEKYRGMGYGRLMVDHVKEVRRLSWIRVCKEKRRMHFMRNMDLRRAAMGLSWFFKYV